MKQYYLFLILPILFVSPHSYSQISYRYPVVFEQVERYSSFINPSEVSTDSHKAGIVLSNQNLLGPFNNIRTFIGQGFFTLNKDSIKKSKIGANFYSDKEGSYISNTRGYLTYSYQLSIAPNLQIASALAIGISTITYQNSQSSNSTSASALDGNLSLALVQNRFRFCFGINQFPQQTVFLIDERLTFKRYYSFYAVKNLDINYALRLNFIGMFSLKSNQVTDINFTSSLIVKKHFNIGLGYWFNRGIITLVGFDNIIIQKNTFRFVFSYSLPLLTSSTYLNQEQIALAIGYNFR